MPQSHVDDAVILHQVYKKMLQLVLTNPIHVSFLLLPDETDQHYYLRARCHNRELVDDSNRPYSNTLQYTCCIKLLLICVQVAF